MKRPDLTDQAQAAARHRRCLCGHTQPCECLSPPSSGWRQKLSKLPRPLLRSDAWLLYAMVREQLNAITEEIRIMGAREDAADARTGELIELVRQHVGALQSDNDNLRAALASADADKAAALDAESDADAGRQEVFNSALDELAGNAAPPADSGDVSPADDGSAPATDA